MDKEQQLGGKITVNGKTFPVYGGVNTIGRNREAIVNIKNLGISQNHAIIILVDDDLHFISDLKSSNGTFLNGTRLAPLQLYQIGNNASVKFADIEGLYHKLPSEDGQTSILPENPENTQNFTQTFYGTDTQIMDDTSSIIDTNKTKVAPTQNPYYIPTQVLADAANELEDSYVKFHEQCTLVAPGNIDKTTTQGNSDEKLTINTQIRQEMSNEMVINDLPDDQINHVDVETSNLSDFVKKSSSVDQSLIDFHEAETQKIPNDSSSSNKYIAFHEAETQKFRSDSQEITCGSDTSKNNFIDPSVLEFHNAETQKLPVDSEENAYNSNSSKNVSVNSSELEFHNAETQKITSDVEENVVADLQQAEVQNSERSELNSSHNDERNANLNHSNEQSDSGLPVGVLGINNPEGTDEISAVESMNEVTESIELPVQAETCAVELSQNSDFVSPLGKCRNTINESESSDIDNESDIIKPVKLSKNTVQFSQDSVVDEDDSASSDDSLEFMTAVTKQRMNVTINNEVDSENEDIMKKNEMIIKDKIEKRQKNEETTNSSNKTSSSEDNPGPSGIKRNKNLKQVKNNNESDSETDIETEVAKIKSQNSDSTIENSKLRTSNQKRNYLPIDSGSETEIEDGNIEEIKMKITSKMLSETDIDTSAITEKDISIKMIGGIDNGSDSGSEGDNLMIDETRLEDNQETIRESHEINETLNDTDIIPSTQEESKTVKTSSQASRFENSEESFKLGLTQLMEDDSEGKIPTQTKRIEDKKTATFMEEDDSIYDVNTQKLSEERKIDTTDDHIFLEPTQKLPLKKRIDKNNPDDELYVLSTQKIGDTTEDSSIIEDIYIQSTQKLESRNEGTSGTHSKTLENVQSDDDDDDMFSTQPCTSKILPDKALESELECMFASQRMNVTDENIDRIQDVVFQKPLVDTKLPEQDSDLEAILATQSMISPVRKNTRNSGNKETVLGRSIESQLEVLFASQPNALPSDKFQRPSNPLVNVLKGDSQDAGQIEISLKVAEHSNDVSLENNKSNKNGLEQSFALLDAKATKIKRSTRNTNVEEVTVSCSRSRRSNIVAPNEKYEKILEKEAEMSTRRTTRKRESSAVSSSNEKRAKKSQTSNDTIQSTSTKVTAKDDMVKLPRKSNRRQEPESKSEVLTTRMRASRAINKSDELDLNVIREDDKELSGNNKNSKPKTRATLIKKSIDSPKESTTSSHNKDSSNENNDPSGNSVTRSRRKTQAKKQPVDNSDSQNSSCSSTRSSTKTPLKSRKLTEASTPSNSSDMLIDTPTRNKRKLKPKVVFTMMEDPQAESAIKRLGGSVVDSVASATVLITQSVKRSQKLLSAIGLGKPICSTKWVDASKLYNQFLDPWDFLLVDDQAEENWDFSLETSLKRSLEKKLFDGLTFLLNVTSAADVLKGAIESCGGKVVVRCPKEIKNCYIIATPDNKSKLKKLHNQYPGVPILEPEAIFDGVLRQEMRFERHKLGI